MMKEQDKTKEQLINDLATLRQRVAGSKAPDTDRKQITENLWEKEGRFRAICEKAGAGMVAGDIEGNILEVNPAFCNFLGRSKDELLKLKVIDVTFPEDLAETRQQFEEIKTGLRQIIDLEKRYVRKDGAVVWGHATAVCISDSDLKPIYSIAVIQDITERKKAEEALRESEGYLKTILSSIQTGVIVIDAETHEIVDANKVATDIIGIAKEKITGAICHRFICPREKGYCPITDEEKVIDNSERMLLAADGKKVPIVKSVVPVVLHGRKCLLESFIDISERKRGEKKLENLKRQNELILNSAGEGILGLDLEGRHTFVNAAAETMLGHKVEELIGRPSHSIWHHTKPDGSSYPAEQCQILSSYKDGMTHSVANEFFWKKDGTGFPVEYTSTPIIEKGSLVGAVVTFTDILERKRAEEALQKSEEQARQLAQENAIMAEIGKIISSTLNIDKVYDRFAAEARKLIPFDRININIINPEEKTVTAAYGTGSVVSGRQPGDVFPLAGTALEEIMRTHSGLLVQTDNASDLAERFPGLLPHFQAGQRSMLGIPLISKDRVIGGLFLGSDRLNSYTNRDLKLAESIGSQIAGAIANAQLFSERQRLEERLRRAEKMEAMGTLAGGVAHDLNNVLGVLVGYSELLLMEIPGGSPLRRHVSNILQSGQRAAAIIQDLLTLARRGVVVSEVLNLNNVISDYFKTPEFEKLQAYHPQVTFKTDLDKDVMNIKGSPIHLSKTIMNLLSNAAEAVTDRGKVTLVTENCYLDKPITGFDDIREGDYVVLRVSDNGRGISATDIGKIFEPFYTKKVMGRSGTGLGLAVVWGTVKDHHGYIDVQSEEGGGSIFTLYFPATREEMVSDQKVISAESYVGRGESILVVDDVREQRQLAMAMLSGLGYRVSSVSSGEEAVTYLKANRVDLLVLDMIMDPGMDGLETYQKVLEINPKQKAIIVSGYSETDRVKKAQELGAGAYVRKPYIREKIGLSIKKELGK